MQGLTSNVIFALGVVGADKTKAKFMAVAGAVAFVGVQLVEVAKNAEKFALAWNQLGAAQKRAIMEADKASMGIIDTFQIVEARAKLAKAGIEISGKALSDVVKVSIVDGQKLGHTAEQITADFDKIVTGLAKGQTRVFKEMGKEFKDGATQAEVAEKGLEFLAKRAEKGEVKIRTLSEGFFALSNNMETAAGIMAGKMTTSMMGGFSILEELNKSLSGFVGTLEASEQATWNFNMSLEGLTINFGKMLLTMLDWATGITPLVELVKLFDESAGQSLEQMLIGGTTDRIRAILDEAAADQKSFYSSTRRGLDTFGGTSQPDIVTTFDQQSDKTDTSPVDFDFTKKKKKKTFGGSGRRRKQKTDSTIDMDFTEGGAIDNYDSEVGWLLDRAGAQREVITVDDLFVQKEAEKIQRSLDATESRYEVEETRHATHFENMLGIEDRNIKQSNALWESGAQGKLDTSKKFLSNFGRAQDAQTKAGFELMKVANTGETIASTATGAISAYKAMAGIPYVGPALGVAAAAAVTGFGMMQLKKIQGLQFGQKAGGNVSAPPVSLPAPDGNFSGRGEESQPIINQIIVDGNIIQEQVIEANRKALNSNEPAFAMVGA